MTKTIRDNYRIYSLIIILNARIIVNVRCELFKMLNMNNLTMFLPFWQLVFNYKYLVVRSITSMVY